MVKNVEFAVIGMGRFGTIWAKELSKYYSVSCYDINSNLETSVSSFAEFITLDECLTKDYIFLTIPINAIKKFLMENSVKFIEGNVICDCASVKEEIINWYQELLPPNIEYGSLHPLFGPDSIVNGFEGNTITFTNGNISEEKKQFLFALFKKKMRLIVNEIEAADHDNLMAYNLSLVHMLGRVLHEMNVENIPLKMDALKNFSKLIGKVMNDRDELFYDFFKYNKYSNKVHKEFIAKLGKVSDAISESKLNY